MAKKNLLNQRLNNKTLESPSQKEALLSDRDDSKQFGIRNKSKRDKKNKALYVARQEEHEDRIDTEETVILSEKKVKEKKSVFKKKQSAIQRVQLEQPALKEETKEERLRRVYAESTLNVDNALPPIKDEDSEFYEQELERTQNETSLRNVKLDKFVGLLQKLCNAALVLVSFYLVFLIYGAFVTNYEYNEHGAITPCIVTVEDIKQKKEFDLMLSFYEETRSIYEQIYMIDYRLSLGDESPLVLAPEYESMLEQISAVSISLESTEFSAKYSVVKALLLDWIKNHSALYVQNMTSAIATNDAQAANNAIAYRSSMYACFVSITDNLLAVGNGINGVYTDDIEEWSLDNFLYTQIYGQEDK